MSEIAVAPNDSWPSWCRRVLFVTPDFPVMAGGSVYVESMGRAFEEAGLEVDVLSIYPGKEASALRHRSVFPEKTLYKEPALAGRTGMARLRALPRWVRKRWTEPLLGARAVRHLRVPGPDCLLIVTHVSALRALVKFGFSLSQSRALTVGQHHSSYESIDTEPALRQELVQLFSTLDGFTALSVDDATAFQRLLGVPTAFMPNPLRARSATATDDLTTRARRVTALARFSAEKRLPLMIRLIDLIFDDPCLEGWSFHLYGDGPEREKVLRTAAAARHANRIVVEPATATPLEVLADSQLHLVTSEYEGFSLSTLEAASQGVPTVAFDVSPGLRDLVRATGGILVPPEDTTGFVSAVTGLLLDNDARACHGALAAAGSGAYQGTAVVDRWAAFLHTLR